MNKYYIPYPVSYLDIKAKDYIIIILIVDYIKFNVAAVPHIENLRR